MKRFLSLIFLATVVQFTYAQINTEKGQAAGHNGSYNSSFGYFAGDKVTGQSNTFVGAQTGRYTTTGNYNTYLGRHAGITNVTGSNNVAVGYRAGYSATGSGNVFLGRYAGYYETGSNKLYIENSSTSTLPLIYGDFTAGAVGINTKTTSGYTLSVNGKIRASEVRVYTGWADYVFEDKYRLRPLTEVESFIQQNNHLPDVPSAKVVEKEGILVGEMNATLLRKIEELTLYMIKANKSINALQKEVKQLKKENQAMKAGSNK